MGFLRLWLAIAVYLEHLGAEGWPREFYPIDGYVAVNAFYLISGFLIQLIIAQKSYGTLAFWKSRFLRIYPLYWLVLAGSILFVVFSDDHQEPQYYLHSLMHDQGMPFEKWHYQLIAEDHNWLDKLAYVVSQLGIFGSDLALQVVYSLDLHHFIRTNGTPAIGYLWGGSFSLIPQAWSLAIELWFYLLAPFLLTRHVALVIGIGFASGSVASYLRDIGFYADSLIVTTLYIFLLGALACRFYLKCLHASGRRYEGIAWCMLVVLVFYSLAFRKLALEDKAGIFYAMVFLALPFLFKVTKNNRLDCFLGELSYPIYLCHFLTYAISEVLFTGYTASYAMPVVTLLFAVLAVFLVERPLDRYRHKKFRQPRPPLVSDDGTTSRSANASALAIARQPPSPPAIALHLAACAHPAPPTNRRR
jgi:peptidoglycan/LPS O-acetylase OafA/YrhL